MVRPSAGLLLALGPAIDPEIHETCRPAAVAAAALALTPATAVAAPTLSSVYPLPGAGDLAGTLTLGPDGSMWAVLSGGGSDIAQITPSGQITAFAIAGIDEASGIAAGPDGNLWVTQPGAVARFSPSDPTGATTFALPAIATPGPIVAGPDGNLWTASGGAALQIPPAAPAAAQSFTVPGMSARGITATSDSLWIADAGSDRLVQLSTSGTPTYWSTGAGSAPVAVAAGAGGVVGYVNSGTDVRGDGDAGTVSPPANPQQIETGITPTSIAFGSDQAWWLLGATQVGRLAPPSFSEPFGLGSYNGSAIAAGAGSTLWISLQKPVLSGVPRVVGAVGVVTGLGTPGSATIAPSALQFPPASPFFRRIAVASRSRQGRAIGLGVQLSNASTLTVDVDRKLQGRLAGGRCVTPVRERRGAGRCTRFVQASSTTVRVRGSAQMSFGAGLPAGAYRLTLVAQGRGAPARVVRALTIVPRPGARR